MELEQLIVSIYMYMNILNANNAKKFIHQAIVLYSI